MGSEMCIRDRARRIPPGHARVPLDIMNGTVSHMAPELLNDKFMSRATDVYSFGVLLWEIAAQGETPFSGIDAVDVVAAVVKHDLRPKFAENAFWPLVQLATRCWHADPHERPSFELIGVDLSSWEPLVTFQRVCLLYTSPSPRDLSTSRMPSSA